MVIANTYPITIPISSEIGGIVFAIPEQNDTETSEEREVFWVRCSCRLENLVKEINFFNPIARFLNLLTYFPLTKETSGGVEHDPTFVEAVEVQKYFQLQIP
ncbi:hypothetical protein G6F43_012077 [Rhizopus delemar]|nr:hypothetical protein G6F43_012077 [Rhizopus delemar]